MPDGDKQKERQPKIENHCRDHLVIRLNDWLKEYGNITATSEAQLNTQVRVDLLDKDDKGHALPVDIKMPRS